MLWAFQQLKGVYPNHVTCIAYGLRRVCESIRENYNSVNDVIVALKKILLKPPSRHVLCQELNGLHLPWFCYQKVGYFDKMHSFLVQTL